MSAVADNSRSARIAPLPSRRRLGSESFEVEIVAAYAEIPDDVGDDAPRHVARMPREGDQTIRVEWIGIMAVAAGRTNVFAANLTQAPVKLTAVPRWVSSHGSGGEDEFVAKGGRDGAAGFEQRLEMRLGRELKTKAGLAPVASVGVAAGKQGGFGNPHPILVTAQLNLGKRDNHREETLAGGRDDVKKMLDALRLHQGQAFRRDLPFLRHNRRFSNFARGRRRATLLQSGLGTSPLHLKAGVTRGRGVPLCHRRGFGRRSILAGATRTGVPFPLVFSP